MMKWSQDLTFVSFTTISVLCGTTRIRNIDVSNNFFFKIYFSDTFAGNSAHDLFSGSFLSRCLGLAGCTGNLLWAKLASSSANRQKNMNYVPKVLQHCEVLAALGQSIQMLTPSYRVTCQQPGSPNPLRL